MATEVRRQLDAKLSTSAKPTPIMSTPSLWPDKAEMKKKHMIEETQEKVESLRRAGIKATVVVEAE